MDADPGLATPAAANDTATATTLPARGAGPGPIVTQGGAPCPLGSRRVAVGKPLAEPGTTKATPSSCGKMGLSVAAQHEHAEGAALLDGRAFVAGPRAGGPAHAGAAGKGPRLPLGQRDCGKAPGPAMAGRRRLLQQKAATLPPQRCPFLLPPTPLPGRPRRRRQVPVAVPVRPRTWPPGLVYCRTPPLCRVHARHRSRCTRCCGCRHPWARRNNATPLPVLLLRRSAATCPAVGGARVPGPGAC